MKMILNRSDSLKSMESINHEHEIETLKTELENEKIFRDNAKYRNSEIEKAISKIQEQLQQEDFPWDQDNELKNVQIKMEELTEEITKLNDEMPELKNKLRNAKACGKECKMKHDDLNINLNAMNEVDLLKTTKRLERMRTDLKSALVGKEWSLDNESKMYQRILDQKMHLQNALYHTNLSATSNKSSAFDRWQNGAISKTNRTLDLKKGPINQKVAREIAPLKKSPKAK